MAKKSAAQIRRMQMRAEKRGEEYVPPEVPEDAEENKQPDKPKDGNNKKLVKAAQKLKKELEAIQNNETLRAKERRSQKRKAEAIAAEAAGCSAEEMEKWLEENKELLENLEKEKTSKKTPKTTTDDEGQEHRNPTPYIVFVGQLAYSTSKESLFTHIQKELSDEHKITTENVKVRLLTDAKTKRSRGIAFVELTDPELMYACLRLHHTLLEGRRLNVERSVGGRKKETRDAKIKQFREQQEEYLNNVIDSIIGDFIKSGELQEGELDEGAIGMCKRYSANMVETAIKQYIENNGRAMDNTSAYFSFLLSKLAADKAEGFLERGNSSGKDSGRPSKRPKSDNSNHKGKPKTISPKSSLPGVDFSMSEKDSSGADNSLAKIFPSLTRGRGRGRGYM